MCIRANGLNERYEPFLMRRGIHRTFALPTGNANVFPGDKGTIIRPSSEHGFELVEATWGLQPYWAPRATYGKTFCYNARSEGSEEKSQGIEKMATYREPFKTARCIVPASAFFERVGPKGEQHWFRFRKPDDEPFLFAGLWLGPNKWTEIPTYTIVTTAPPDGHIHDRIPVILEEGEDIAWMATEAPLEGLRALMTPRSDHQIIVEDFEPVVYKAKANKAVLIESD